MSRLSPSLELRAVAHARPGAPALREFSLTFAPAVFHALTGDAGCGALLRIAGLLDRPEAGDVLVGGVSTRALADDALMDLRSQRFGYVFAAPYLLPAMTVVENVAMPLFKISGAGIEEARERTDEVLEFAGLAGGARINVGELTWAEQQRVALARGLIHRPAMLIVEPADAGATPGETARFFDLLRAVPGRFGAAVIAVLSAADGFAKSDRVVIVENGVVGAERRLPASESSPS